MFEICSNDEIQVGNRDTSQGKTTITVPAEKIGLVIGRGSLTLSSCEKVKNTRNLSSCMSFLGGETVKQLQQQTGARIIVEKHAQGPEQPIIIMGKLYELKFSWVYMSSKDFYSIIGSPEAVQQAQQLIQELLTNVSKYKIKILLVRS